MFLLLHCTFCKGQIKPVQAQKTSFREILLVNNEPKRIKLKAQMSVKTCITAFNTKAGISGLAQQEKLFIDVMRKNGSILKRKTD